MTWNYSNEMVSNRTKLTWRVQTPNTRSINSRCVFFYMKYIHTSLERCNTIVSKVRCILNIMFNVHQSVKLLSSAIHGRMIICLINAYPKLNKVIVDDIVLRVEVVVILKCITWIFYIVWCKFCNNT